MASNLGLAGLGAPSLNRTPRKQSFSQPPTGPAGSGGLGAFGALTKPRAPAAGVGSAGSTLLRTVSPKPRVNPGIGSAGGALLGATGGGGARSGAGAAATLTQAPPPPTPAQQDNIGLVPADEQSKAAAQATYGTDTAAYLHSLQDAAMRYGDPTAMSALGLGTTVNPNSALALAALRAQQQQVASGNARESAGTFFSSLHGMDLSNIANAQQRAQLAGQQRYQDALSRYTYQMNTALNALNNATNSANVDERQNAINNLPTPSNAAGTFTGGSPNVTSKVPTKGTAGKTSGAKGSGKLSSPKLPKSPKKPPSLGGAGKAVSNAPSRGVSSVKQPPRKSGGSRGRRG